MSALLDARNLVFSYRIGGRSVRVLRHVDLEIRRGDMVAIQGPSGSGKSTLLYLLAGLLHPESGHILLDGVDFARAPSDELAALRNRSIGFIFQQFHLLPRSDVLENILLPAFYPCETARVTAADRAKAEDLARRFGLGEHLTHLPNQLSGGQQQRVAICRALMRDPDLILADEPTGNLDSRSAAQILDHLKAVNAMGKAVVIITHDSEVARQCSRVYRLRDGRIVQTTEAEAPAVSAPESVSEAEAGVEAGGREGERPRRIPPGPRLPLAGEFARHVKLATRLLPLARENLRRNRARSLLTMLGITIGVSAMLAMVTLGQFTKERILATYEVLGVNRLGIGGWPNWELKASEQVGVQFRQFDMEGDLLPLKRIFPDVRLLAPLVMAWSGEVTFGGRALSERVRIVGTTPEMIEITDGKLLVGRNLTPYHVERKSAVCVIGYEIAARLFKDVGPEGQMLSIKGDSSPYACRVIGVTARVETNDHWRDPNFMIVMPYTYFQSQNDQWNSRISRFQLEIRQGADVEWVGKSIKAYFERKYGKSGRFNVESDAVLIAQMKRFLNLFTLMLGAIALISLIVGGIGIANMMLVSVSERLKEIGLRKAVGATDLSVRVQFLVESVAICVIAGVAGLVLGFVAYQGTIYGATRFVKQLKFEWVVDPMAALLSLGSIVLVGLASGIVPALKAEKLEVVEALRAE